MSVTTANAQEVRIGHKVFSVHKIEFKIAGLLITSVNMKDEHGLTHNFDPLQAHDENGDFGYTGQYVACALWKREILKHDGEPVIFEIDDSDMVTVIS